MSWAHLCYHLWMWFRIHRYVEQLRKMCHTQHWAKFKGQGHNSGSQTNFSGICNVQWHHVLFLSGTHHSGTLCHELIYQLSKQTAFECRLPSYSVNDVVPGLLMYFDRQTGPTFISCLLTSIAWKIWQVVYFVDYTVHNSICLQQSEYNFMQQSADTSPIHSAVCVIEFTWICIEL